MPEALQIVAATGVKKEQLQLAFDRWQEWEMARQAQHEHRRGGKISMVEMGTNSSVRLAKGESGRHDWQGGYI